MTNEKQTCHDCLLHACRFVRRDDGGVFVNQIAKLNNYEVAIQDARSRFDSLAGGLVNYGDEEIFAMQMLTKNDFVFQTANRNPTSVQLAMINVASTGLTLNPAMGYAYLVPRDGAIMLDISYKGLIKIATDTGAIKWARAECVYESDKFSYHGPAAMPEIVANPFGVRGEIIGSYCIVKTADGDILTEVMDLQAIEMIRSKSTAWVKGGPGKKGPWEDFFSEMCRKAVIKRARKTWPYTEKSERLAKAVEISNQAEGGYVFDEAGHEATAEEKEAERKRTFAEALGRHEESMAFIRDLLKNNKTDDALDEWRAIDEADRKALWLAPTKGGYFTKEERDKLLSVSAVVSKKAISRAADNDDRAAEAAAKEQLK